jgi:hypothetical protein
MLLPLLQESIKMVHFGSKCSKPREGEKKLLHPQRQLLKDNKGREQEPSHKDTRSHTEVTLWYRICANKPETHLMNSNKGCKELLGQRSQSSD